MEIITIPITQLRAYGRNPRKNKAAVKYVAESISQFGFKVPIVIDTNNVIVCGHTRFAAAKQLGIHDVPCIVADDLTDEQIQAFRLADNKVAEKAEWDNELLFAELSSIVDIDMKDFGFDFNFDLGVEDEEESEPEEEAAPPMQHNVFENQDTMQFPCVGFYGMPEIQPTKTIGEKMLRFMDWKEVEDPENYIAHFYYDDYKFISAWREPEKYIERLKRFKAVVSPDFSLYTDFPRALQILSCYRRQWCGAFWQYHGIDVIPDVVWGDKDSFSYCFDGIPQYSTVAVSTVGVKRDNEWNNKEGDMFRAGYEEMMKRLKPTTVLFYGDMIDGLEGNIIRIPSYYEQKRQILNERMKRNG